MKLLIVGGTGNISWRLTNAALAEGWHVTLLNRGAGTRRPVPPGCDLLRGDIRDVEETRSALGSQGFDVVVDFLCYNAAQAESAISLFRERTAHYIFISTTAFYDRSLASQPLTEKSPIISSGWDYAIAKAQAEKIFVTANESFGFPVTIIRPAHTYDITIPEAVGNSDWTNPWRLLNNQPVVVHGDGTTLWTVTHSSDLARGIISFLRGGHAPGETFHITSDRTTTWRTITQTVGQAIGIENPNICYRTTEEIDRVSNWLGNGIKGHKMWCDVYDNKKFKSACPGWQCEISFEEGILEAIEFFRADPQRLEPNQRVNSIIEAVVALR